MEATTKKLLLSVAGALCAGFGAGYASGRGNRASTERRLDLWEGEELAERREQRAVQAELDRLAEHDGHVYWIETADDDYPAIAILDDPGTSRLYSGLIPDELVNDREVEERVTGDILADLLYNLKFHRTVFDIPHLGRVRVNHGGTYSQDGLPKANGSLHVVQMDENTRENQIRLNEYLVDLVRVRALEEGGAFKSWPKKRPDGTWPPSDGWYWVDSGGVWDNGRRRQGLGRGLIRG